jgi:hypothetical protein
VIEARPGPGEAVQEMMAMYQRLAAKDAPAPRTLAGELEGVSDESLAPAALQAGPAAQAKARRDARRAAAARAALDSLDTEGRAAAST